MNNSDGRRMTDEEYDDWLRSVEEAAADKEEVDPPSKPWGSRQRIQVIISNHQIHSARNPETFIREVLETHYRFDLSAPITRAPVVDQDAIMFYGYMKEDHDDDDELADELVQAYLLRYGPIKAGGEVRRGIMHELFARERLSRSDSFPRPDDFKFHAWSPDEDSDYRRSAGKD